MGFYVLLCCKHETVIYNKWGLFEAQIIKARKLSTREVKTRASC